MTPYFFKQMRKRTGLCLVVVLTALAFSLALCMLQRSRDQMAVRIEEVYDNLEVRCSVTNLTGTQSDRLNLPEWVLRLFTTGMTTDVDSFMFGSILALDRADVALSVGVSAAVLVLYVLFYHRLFAITFDESFSRATGMRVELYNTVLSVLTALTIVLGMRLMGAMLISSLVIFPALTAMRVCGTFRSVTICAAVVSVVNFLLGMVLFFQETLRAWAAGSALLTYVLFTLTGVNFLVELGLNLVLSPAVSTLIRAIRKTHN